MIAQRQIFSLLILLTLLSGCAPGYYGDGYSENGYSSGGYYGGGYQTAPSYRVVDPGYGRRVYREPPPQAYQRGRDQPPPQAFAPRYRCPTGEAPPCITSNDGQNGK